MSKPSKPTDKPSTDELVLQLFNTVRARQQEIKDSEKPRWITNCTIGTNPDTVTDRVNIQTVSDTAKLAELYAFLLMKKDYWDRATAALGIKAGFKWMGFTIESWLTDFTTRIAQIELNSKRKELAALESRLDALITVEQRRALELAEICDQLDSN